MCGKYGRKEVGCPKVITNKTQGEGAHAEGEPAENVECRPSKVRKEEPKPFCPWMAVQGSCRRPGRTAKGSLGSMQARRKVRRGSGQSSRSI